MLRCRDHKFPKASFPSSQVTFLQNGPELSRARRFGAAQRTLDSEDRSETIYDEGKEELQLDSISEAQQAIRLHLHVATIVLSERRTVPDGNVSGVRNRWHLTRLSELKWIRQAKAVESLAFHTRI